ncbi:hypothetical protein D9M70_533570 [compost metagenome]
MGAGQIQLVDGDPHAAILDQQAGVVLGDDRREPLRITGVGFEIVSDLCKAAGDLLASMIDGRAHQRGFRAEVVGHRAMAAAGLLGDAAQTQAVMTIAHDDPQGRLDQRETALFPFCGEFFVTAGRLFCHGFFDHGRTLVRSPGAVNFPRMMVSASWLTNFIRLDKK